jgi:DNA replication and repair protein RecF
MGGVERKTLPHQHTLPVVFFEPQHMNMLVGEPAGRRRFLDDILEQTSPGFAAHSKNYKRALVQRNALLKRIAGTHKKGDLFVWDLRLSELGGAVHQARKSLTDIMARKIELEYARISGKQEPVAIQYSSTVSPTNYTDSLLKKLLQDQDHDIARGYTGAGPHREDFVLLLRGHDARASASRGETRSLLLALKVLELYALEDSSGKRPLLLLDDVFSELDGKRRKALADTLSGYQTFITTTDADLVVEHFMASTNIIPLS